MDINWYWLWAISGRCLCLSIEVCEGSIDKPKKVRYKSFRTTNQHRFHLWPLKIAENHFGLTIKEKLLSLLSRYKRTKQKATRWHGKGEKQRKKFSNWTMNGKSCTGVGNWGAIKSFISRFPFPVWNNSRRKFLLGGKINFPTERKATIFV